MGCCASKLESQEPVAPPPGYEKPTKRVRAMVDAHDERSAEAKRWENPEGVDFMELHSAVRWEKMDDVKKLFTSKELAEVRDEANGNTPLHIAAQNGHVAIIEFLLNLKAAPNAQNGGGQSPLHMAKSYDYDDVAEKLIAAGADPELQNADGVPAKFGLSGEKSPDHPEYALEELKGAETEQGLLDALNLVEQHPPEDKASLVIAGLYKKKESPVIWTDGVHLRFRELLNTLETSGAEARASIDAS